jgi:hypothetical protein
VTAPDSSRAPASLTPTPKVVAGGAAGALTVILVWVARLIGLDVPPEVAAAVTLLLTSGAAYLTPQRPV